MIVSLLLFIFSFVLLWIGSGLAVSAVSKIAHSLRISSFFVSFFILGLFTSITEIVVGITAVFNNQPEIFVGNLIGSSVVVFLFVIPLLAIVGNGIALNHSFRFKELITAVMVVGFPALLTLDNRIGVIDTIICIGIYAYFIYMQEKSSHSIGKLVFIDLKRSTIYTSLAKILCAIAIVLVGSNILVTQTTNIATLLGVSPFVVSILIISVGTNMPELSIAVRAILAKKKDIAFGNYVGSAALNTLEMGLLSALMGGPVPANGSNYSVLTFLLCLGLFVYFGKSRNTLSRQEGLVLVVGYLLFILFELLTGPGWNFILAQATP